MQGPQGTYLRQLRDRLNLSVREVQKASAVIAAEEQNFEFYISASRLTQIETEETAPSPYKIFSLSVIYGIDYLNLLQRYMVNLDRIHHYRQLLKLDVTRLVTADIYNVGTTVSLPVRLDPSFRWETTQLINRVVALWGEIPAAFLQELNPRRQMYGYIGLEDFTLYPLLRPGALVMIDGSSRRVAQTGWINEFERPIYFIELRSGYRCAWCQVDGPRIVLIPHPMSPVGAETFSCPDEAEIVGRVVGVAMRLVPPK